MLVPNEEQQATMAIEAQLMTSTERNNNEDYLSKGFRHGPAGIGRDIFLFPVRNKRTRVFCVVIARPHHMEELLTKVSGFLARD